MFASCSLVHAESTRSVAVGVAVGHSLCSKHVLSCAANHAAVAAAATAATAATAVPR